MSCRDHARQFAQVVFDRADKSGDGDLSKTEIRTYFESMDLDGNNKFDCAEFVEAVVKVYHDERVAEEDVAAMGASMIAPAAMGSPMGSSTNYSPNNDNFDEASLLGKVADSDGEEGEEEPDSRETSRVSIKESYRSDSEDKPRLSLASREMATRLEAGYFF